MLSSGSLNLGKSLLVSRRDHQHLSLSPSINPGCTTLGFAELPPRQLAPSVGRPKSVGIMVAPAPSAMKTDVRVTRESICFGSFEYVLHPPARRSVYADLDKGIHITFGSVCCFADSRGILRSAATAPRATAPASANLPPPSSKPAKIASVAPGKIASVAPAKISPTAPAKIASTAPAERSSPTSPSTRSWW